ncbi:DNA polymerase III subunit gamma/tau [Motiliproteus coralliicola]|uniref:DNA polymerase III subunit gamma/tau n=1 Tax=Motiliproteus coralliicola TaxID=2283196 RepID=A0A369WMD8_9GAMM|nr:DNA polymerase III subunit gamma/tau [Motiliproteus coralliicola]RDE22651.1 DNA polymerase III subunit gamma/tau [Motiliproteus coralliicola]
MSYQVLARKWRPSTFEGMVGQEHVLQALVNALDSDRLHHAYLFTGTRGVGKTSIARLFAKSLNCEHGVSSKPCGQCSPCREISEGRFVDLIEVDAASRTKVEDTRELMENVQYAPTRGRYKVYLIDEVHMLSTHSFNALLKTLEEPPPHIKFLLATTDPQKLPVTILSRCLQFNLKNMVPEKIVAHLQQVLRAEQIRFEEQALWLLARGANGSMRDAMSLTDQGIAYGSGELREADVRAMLGTVDQHQVLGLLQQLAQGSAQGVLDLVRQISELGADSDAILAELLSLLHRIGIAQMLPQAVDNSQGDRDAILALAQSLRAEDVQLFYQIGVNGRRDLPHVPVAREGLEMTLLRMLAFRPVAAGELALPQGDVPQLASKPEPIESEPAAAQANASAAGQQSQQPPVVPPSATIEPEHDRVSSAPAQAPVESQVVPEPAADRQPPVAEPHDPPPWGEPTPMLAGGESKKPEAPTASESESVSRPPWESSDEPAPSTPNPQPQSPLAGSPVAQADTEVASATFSSDRESSAESSTAMPVDQAPEPPSEASDSVVTTAQPHPVQELDVRGGDLARRWVEVIDQIGLSGMTYNIAANAWLDDEQQGRWRFCLANDRRHLFNDTHQQRLAKALSDFLGQPQQVEVVEGSSEAETPAGFRQRKREERQAEAVRSIETDANVRAIVAAFDARIDLASVRPIDAEQA